MRVCEGLREFLRKGTWTDLGFYLYLRRRVRVGEWFKCRELGKELFLDPVTIYGRLRRLRDQGAIAFEGSRSRYGAGVRITAFKLEVD